MVDPVGFRFRPTNEEIVEHYLRPKNLNSNTSHVDNVISTVDIYSFDPWELPSQSRIKSTDDVWFFFGCKKSQHNRGDRQSRRTKSGFWKKTGPTTDIKRKNGNREKMGEKRVLVFQYSKLLGGSKSKSDWVMHEYVATFLNPNQMMMLTYTVCKVMFKGDEREISSASASASASASGIEHIHSLIPRVNTSSGVLSTETEKSPFELQNPRQFSGFLHVEVETQLEDALDRAFNKFSTDDWNYLLNNDDDDDEQRKIMCVQEDHNDYRPKKSQTCVFVGHSSDDSDSDSISATTSSIQTSSTCDSFGSSIRRIHQIKDLQESPTSKIELVSVTQEENKALGTNIDTSEKEMNPYDDDAQGSEIGGDQMGHEMVNKNKRNGFIYRMIQRFTKKIKLCSSCISRT